MSFDAKNLSNFRKHKLILGLKIIRGGQKFSVIFLYWQVFTSLKFVRVYLHCQGQPRSHSAGAFSRPLVIVSEGQSKRERERETMPIIGFQKHTREA